MEKSKRKKRFCVLPSIYQECHCVSVEYERANISFPEFLRALHVAILLLHMFWDTILFTHWTNRSNLKGGGVKRTSQFYLSTATGRRSLQDFPACCFSGCLHSHHNIQISEKPTSKWLSMLCITSKKLVEVTENQASSFLKGGTCDHIYKEKHSS